jgi:hypothetical protein
MKSKTILALHVMNGIQENNVYFFEDKPSLRSHLQKWVGDNTIRMVDEDEELIETSLDDFLSNSDRVAEVALGFPHQYPFVFTYTYEQLYSL